MSLQSRVTCWWIRARIKRKPAGEQALVEFTRKVFATPRWAVAFHSSGVEIEQIDKPVKGEWVSPPNSADSSHVIYYLHGGGYVSGSAKAYRPITATLTRRLKVRSFAIDYRLAPENRFPAALDDALAGYRWLVSTGINPGLMSVVGDSAGGGLALALVMKLRDLGEPLPSAVACLSPWTDMAGTGQSITSNSNRDPFFCAEDVERYANLYLGAQGRQTPLASPLYGGFAGLPPLLIQVGEDEMLLDDARQVHDKAIAAGGSSELRIFKSVPHVWQLMTPFVPEARVALREIAEFITRHRTKDTGSPPRYPGEMNLLDARSLFFARSGLGPDGGYTSRWVRVETKPVPVYFPNTRRRVEAAKLHDLHHIANEYETDWLGEAEIAAWEIASGCGRHLWAWLLNLGAFAVGMVLFPKRLFRAFVRGRRATNFYREGFPEERLSEITVGWLRDQLGVDNVEPEINGADRWAFAFWCAVAVAYHAALPVMVSIVVFKVLL